MIIQRIDFTNFPNIGNITLDFTTEDTDGGTINTLDVSLKNTIITYPNAIPTGDSSRYFLTYESIYKFLATFYLSSRDRDFSQFTSNTSFSIYYRIDKTYQTQLFWFSCLISEDGFLSQRLVAKEGLNSVWETVFDIEEFKEDCALQINNYWDTIYYISNIDFELDFTKHGLQSMQEKLLKSSYGNILKVIYEYSHMNSIRLMLVNGLRQSAGLNIKNIIPLEKNTNDAGYLFKIEYSSGDSKYLIQEPKIKEIINILAIALSKIAGIMVILDNFDEAFQIDSMKFQKIDRTVFLSREGFKNEVPAQRILHLRNKEFYNELGTARYLPPPK